MTVDKKFTQSYFDTAYGPYYRLRNPRYKWQAFLREITRYASTGSLLDIGCAYGLFLQEAYSQFKCTGVDISQHAVIAARKTLPADIPLFTGAVGNLHVDAKFDLITCFDILEHTKDLGEALDNIHDLLEDGGVLAITVPVYDGPLGWLVDKLDKDETHTYRCPRDFWLEEISKRFEILDHIGIWRYFFFHRYYLNLMSRMTRRITPALMIVARKSGDK